MHSRINNETINHIIKIPQNVLVEIEENLCTFKGPHGTILHKINKLISIKKKWKHNNFTNNNKKSR